MTISEKSRKTSVLKKTPRTYPALRSAVRQVLEQGRVRAIAAVKREKVRTAWEAGRLVLNHVLLKKNRSEYGASVLLKLSQDLGISVRNLRYMVEFAREYPIRQPVAELSWSHYTCLLGVNDVALRKTLTEQAVAGNWKRDKLQAVIRRIRKKEGAPLSSFEVFMGAERQLTAPPRGKPGIYKTFKWQDKIFYDLGFSAYVQSRRSKKRRVPPKPEELYYYDALLERVVDGDTVWVNVHLGFGIWSRQKLRLRGLDAPELRTRAGVRAKAFLDKRLKPGQAVLLRTHKADKYDRYLTDLWAGDEYINAVLVNNRLAAAAVK